MEFLDVTLLVADHILQILYLCLQEDHPLLTWHRSLDRERFLETVDIRLKKNKKKQTKLETKAAERAFTHFRTSAPKAVIITVNTAP